MSNGLYTFDDLPRHLKDRFMFSGTPDMNSIWSFDDARLANSMLAGFNATAALSEWERMADLLKLKPLDERKAA